MSTTYVHPTKKIDFFASWPHYFDHMVPIWRALGSNKGNFFVPENLEQYALSKGVVPSVLPRNKVAPRGDDPLLVAAHADLQIAYLENHQRALILMEHGPGIVFPGNSSYAGNKGWRNKATITLAPNFSTYFKTENVLPRMKQCVIGTPMLDPWMGKFEESRTLPEKPTVAIAFHWDGSRVAPEAGSAFKHYEGILPILARQQYFKLIAHGHPRNLEMLRKTYERWGIEVVSDFQDVMDRANLLINDCSSIAYMFLVTGWPVILLNAPWFRKDVNFGLRFWEHTDIGEQVEKAGDLPGVIEDVFSNLEGRKLHRRDAIDALFPYLGFSAQIAARYLVKQLLGEPHGNTIHEPTVRL